MKSDLADKKPKHFKRTIIRLIRYMNKRLVPIIIVWILAVTAVIVQVQIPKILGGATTEIYKGVTEGAVQMQQGKSITSLPIDFNKIRTIILIVLVMYFTSALFNFLQQFIMTRVSQHTVAEMRQELKCKMDRLPISYYDNHSNGDLMSRAINDMDNIAGMFQQNLTQLITNTVTFIGILFMMLTISWQLTLIALATIPMSLIIIMIIVPRSQKNFTGQQKTLGLLNNQVEENYGAHLIVKSFNHERANLEAFNVENEKLYQFGWKAQFVSAIIMPLMNFTKNLGYVFVAVFGGIKVASGDLSLGNVQAFLQYTNQFSQPLTQIASLISMVQSTIASAERIFEIFDEEEMEDKPSGLLGVENGSYKVQFSHVAFGYTPSELLMKDFSLDVTQGEMIAIVGPTGAGKTTLINLLERFYDISGGSIKYEGVDIRDFDRDELRSKFSMVLQETWLFTGTIYDNIKYGNNQASEEEIFQAAKAAYVDEFVHMLPEGYQTILNEEASNISQGQRQLITIARAFLANPEVLILDEATSSVDTRTEILIQQAMKKLLKNRTSFVVAHRLSTIRDADNIVVMNQGALVETGTHQVLMNRNGFYAELYNSQFLDSAI
ncbi:ABC transporter ATP-binding protein [Enterococcus sp. LJL51]|uniref:ABC transporter ATP-binding protein n=1 Tax=Enterococcus sp. LJL51 TaxID=3416656 RepID=UPI003CEA04B4